MADDSDITLNGKLLSELRVVDLKRELEQRGLSKGGSKTQLTDRLRAVRSKFQSRIEPVLDRDGMQGTTSPYQQAEKQTLEKKSENYTL